MADLYRYQCILHVGVIVNVFHMREVIRVDSTFHVFIHEFKCQLEVFLKNKKRSKARHLVNEV